MSLPWSFVESSHKNCAEVQFSIRDCRKEYPKSFQSAPKACRITASAVVLFFFSFCLIASCLAGLAFGCAGLFLRLRPRVSIRIKVSELSSGKEAGGNGVFGSESKLGVLSSVSE